MSVEPWFLAMVALTQIWTARKEPGKQIEIPFEIYFHLEHQLMLLSEHVCDYKFLLNYQLDCIRQSEDL